MPSASQNAEPSSPLIVVEGNTTTTPTTLLGSSGRNNNVEHRVDVSTKITSPPPSNNNNNEQQQNLAEPSTIINDVGNNQTTINIQPSPLGSPNQQQQEDRDYDEEEEEEQDMKPRSRFRRFVSHLFSKSSSFLMGYRFVNFPGLRAHNSIKDPYERLSIAYYSVYFVFHLFFSISILYNHLILATNMRLIIFPTIFAAIGLSSIKTFIVAVIGYILALIQFGWLETIMQGLSLNYGDYFCDILFVSIPFVVAILILNNMHQAFRSQIKEVETRLSNMLNITNEAIIIQSRRKKKIIYVNLAFERMFGYEHDEIIHASKNILDLLVGPPVIATDKWTLCKARTKIGDRFGVEVTHKVDFLSSKKVDVFIIRNNELNDQVKLMNEKAREAQIELQSRTTFFSMISHDLKNPLNSIYLIAQKMHEDFVHQQTVDAHEGLEWMNMILSSCHILSNIIQDVLSSSKLESGSVVLDVSNFDLQYSVEEIISINSVTAFKKGIDVALEIDVKRGSKNRVPIVVRGDVHKFQQILTNLMGNAIKFTHTGSVSVLVDIPEETETTVKVFVVICDTGIGIPQEKQKDLFKVFSRLKKDKEYEGSGLGLSICKNLTTLMNGDIGCKSNGSSGSNFWFTVVFQKAAKGEDYDKIIERAEKRLPLTDESKMMEVKEKVAKNYGNTVCLVLYKESKVRNILSNYLREVFDEKVATMENVETIFVNADKMEQFTEEFLHRSSPNPNEWLVKKPISFIILDDACFLPDNLPKSENALFTAAHVSSHNSESKASAQSNTGRRNSTLIYSPVEIERIYSTVSKLRILVEAHNSKFATNNQVIQPKLIVWFDRFEPKRFLSFIRKDTNLPKSSKSMFDLSIRKPVTLFSFQYMIQQILLMKNLTTSFSGSEKNDFEKFQFPRKTLNSEINLPVVSKDPQPSELSQSQASSSGSFDNGPSEKQLKLRILVADDNNINKNIMLKIFSGLTGNSELENHLSQIKNDPYKLTIETKGAVNGKEALDAFIENYDTPNKFDAIVLDVHMDVMSGLECAEKIRLFEIEKNAANPCMLIGATGDSDGETLCKRAGMDLVCLKPISQTQIRNVVKTILEDKK